jgi:hypothetical protein
MDSKNEQRSLSTFHSVSFEMVIMYFDKEHYDYRAANSQQVGLILPQNNIPTIVEPALAAVVDGHLSPPNEHYFILKRHFTLCGYSKKFLFDGQNHIVLRINPVSHPLFGALSGQSELFIFDSSFIESSTIQNWYNAEFIPLPPNGVERGVEGSDGLVRTSPHSWRCLKSNNEEVHILTYGTCSILTEINFSCYLKFKKIKNPRGLFLSEISVQLPKDFCSQWLYRLNLLRDQMANYGNGVSITKENVICTRSDYLINNKI